MGSWLAALAACRPQSSSRLRLLHSGQPLPTAAISCAQASRFARSSKVHTQVRFSEELDVAPFLAPGALDLAAGAPPHYSLFGVVVHSGRGAEWGHYVAYVSPGEGQVRVGRQPGRSVESGHCLLLLPLPADRELHCVRRRRSKSAVSGGWPTTPGSARWPPGTC